MNSASLCSLAGRYDNPIPSWFLAPIDFLKIPALNFKRIPGIGSTLNIMGLSDSIPFLVPSKFHESIFTPPPHIPSKNAVSEVPPWGYEAELEFLNNLWGLGIELE